MSVCKPSLSEAQRLKRLDFAKTYKHWTYKDWSKVIFLDEAWITLSSNCGKKYIWRRKNEHIDKSYVSKKRFDVKFMVCGYFSTSGPGALKRIAESGSGVEKYNSKKHRETLKHHVVPFMKPDQILQQDNAPCHQGAAKTYLANKKVKTFIWPPNSPDLNPIENLWSIVKRRLEKMKSTTLEELWKNVQTVWKNLEISLLENLVKSMSNRIKLVLKHKGNMTKY